MYCKLEKKASYLILFHSDVQTADLNPVGQMSRPSQELGHFPDKELALYMT